MKKEFWYLCMCALFVVSCTENESLSQLEESPQLRSLGDGQYDVLGYGYDITGQYLDGSSTRAPILDVQSLYKNGFITPSNLESTEYSHYSGTDIVDFSKGMSAGVGLNFLSFVGSFNANFKGSYKFDSKKSYAFYSLEFLKKSFTLSKSTPELKSYLTINFKNHLNTATPKEIVDIYGTHVMTNVQLGARLEAFLETESTVTNKTGAADAKLGFTFQKLFSTNVNYSYDQSLVTKNRNSKFFYKTVGGVAELQAGEFIDVDGTAVSQPQLDIVKWSQSLKSSVPRFVKLNKNSLVPIYELIANSTKKEQVKKYVEEYVAKSQPISVDNYSPAGGVRSISFSSAENQGGGVAIKDIDGNGTPDMVLMGIDNPKGANSYRYKILYDIDQYGNSNKESAIFELSMNTHDNQGGSVAIVDLNNNGKADLIFACIDKTSKQDALIYYQVAYDIDNTGKAKSLSPIYKLPGLNCMSTNGMGIDVYDFNKNGKPDLIYMAYDDPKGSNTFMYKIAYDLNSSGVPTGGYSSLVYKVSGVGDFAEGAGIAVGDINKNGYPDILLAALDAPKGSNKFRYKVLWDVDNAGNTYKTPTEIRPAFTNLDFGSENQGGDCALYDLDKNGTLDIIMMSIDNPKGTNSFRYVTGFNFTSSGQIQNWR